jgi:hypothetical protein
MRNFAKINPLMNDSFQKLALILQREVARVEENGLFPAAYISLYYFS